jgi:hypothetical protein
MNSSGRKIQRRFILSFISSSYHDRIALLDNISIIVYIFTRANQYDQ